MVLVPSGRACCSCFYHIPSGVNTIVHVCGDDAYPDGLAPPGIQCCEPWYNHVAYMVTQQSCTYNAPVKSCPTKDNVMVDCELTLVFSIGPDPTDVKNFVYNLGALKFRSIATDSNSFYTSNLRYCTLRTAAPIILHLFAAEILLFFVSVMSSQIRAVHVNYVSNCCILQIQRVPGGRV